MLAYSRDRVFEGGCFFAAVSADLDSKPGPAADAVRSWTRQWHDYVERQLRIAVECGDLRTDTDVDQLAFELIALAEGANVRSLLANDVRPYVQAASAIRAALLRAGAPPETLGALEL
jgi:hypothetical protein